VAWTTNATSSSALNDLRAIERAIGKRLPRVTVPDFDYAQKPAEKLEIPIRDRIAAIRARKSEDRARAKAKAERRAAVASGASTPPTRGSGAARTGTRVAAARPGAAAHTRAAATSAQVPRAGSGGEPAPGSARRFNSGRRNHRSHARPGRRRDR